MTHAPKNSAVILFRLVLECGRMKLLTSTSAVPPSVCRQSKWNMTKQGAWPLGAANTTRRRRMVLSKVLSDWSLVSFDALVHRILHDGRILADSKLDDQAFHCGDPSTYCYLNALRAGKNHTYWTNWREYRLNLLLLRRNVHD